jgi:uncharacterized protein involved in exopolysaccharide biosynthesis
MTDLDSRNVASTSRGGLFDLITWSRGILVVAFLVCGIAGYLLSGLMRTAYRAEAVTVPVQSANQGLMSGISGLVGSAALAGFGLSPAADKNEAKEILRSRALIRQFIEERNLLPLLCQAQAIGCDPAHPATGAAAVMQMNDAIKVFRDNAVSVDEDTVTGIIRVSLVWYDREQAADWCNTLIALTNRRMQDSARDLAAKRIRYLRQEYERADIVNVQSAISSLLQSEFSRAADASTRPEFALRVIDPATVPDVRYPVRPRKAVIGAASGVFGALLALLVVGVRSRRRT